MADGWHYNGIRIFVTEIRDDRNQIIAELNPINAGTVYHVFGYTSPKWTINAVIVGSGDKALLDALADDGTAYTLSGWDVNYGDYYPRNFQWNRSHSYKQTLRSDLPDTAEVWNLNLELLKT